MNTAKRLLAFIVMIYAVSCNTGTKRNVGTSQQIDHELRAIDSLLRSAEFAFAFAKAQDSAYQAGLGQKPGDFLAAGDDTAFVRKTMLEEKVATNLAGFYALECGIGLLSNKSSRKPTDILSDIVNGKLDSASTALLNRFANATWKAGQPFRDLKRITRSTFTVFNFLPENEVKKDYDQLKSAASKLLFSMQDISNSDISGQMERLRSLLQSEKYAYEMAVFLDSSYAANMNQPVSSFLKSGEDTVIILKPAKDQKVATSIAGFYALECGIAYFVAQKNQPPSDFLHAIIDNSMSREEMMVFARFANATWKAGQPFRGLNRITRQTFTPFYYLSEADIEKDMQQIRAAAKYVHDSLE